MKVPLKCNLTQQESDAAAAHNDFTVVLQSTQLYQVYLIIEV